MLALLRRGVSTYDKALGFLYVVWLFRLSSLCCVCYSLRRPQRLKSIYDLIDSWFDGEELFLARASPCLGCDAMPVTHER